MENFPQTYEPTGSQSILEQFVGLKNFMNNKLNSNEFIKSTPQELTEEEKAQARENIGTGASTINVIDNLSSQSNIDALSANQGRVLNEKIDSSVQTLNQKIAKTLKTPMSAPISTELVGINNSNSQINIGIGDLLQIINGKLTTKQSIKLFWETTETSVGETTINLPTNDYDFLIVASDFITLVVQKNKNFRLQYVDIAYYNSANDSIIFLGRDFQFLNETTILMKDEDSRIWRDSLLLRRTENHYQIPKIYGVKL